MYSLAFHHLFRTSACMPRSRLLALLVVVLGAGLAPSRAYAQIEALPRPDSLETASFGVSVAIDDSIAVVGASGASVCGPDAGAVFVYERRPGPVVTSWTLEARLVPTPCRAEAFFGADIALSGSRLLVSASREDSVSLGDSENAAYIFERSADGAWTQTARLTGRSDRQEGLFAAGVALDGDRAAVSTSGNPDGEYSGSVYVYEYDSSTESWERTARLRGRHRLQSGILGGSVVLDGQHLAVAASTYFKREPGSVYVFRHDPAANRWHEDAHLKGINAFFIALDLHETTLLVGEDRAGDDGRTSGHGVVRHTDGDAHRGAPRHPGTRDRGLPDRRENRGVPRTPGDLLGPRPSWT
ncbi:MAG: hypothetical protein BRD40_01750 [Bacteroidetes bacterium QS_1_65_9]|nr:MAG: hypothetical protein BRD40_01750 [Bacteroidetes bacterium QS_1_65_9]